MQIPVPSDRLRRAWSDAAWAACHNVVALVRLARRPLPCVLRQQVGIAAEAVVGALDAHVDGVVREAIEQRGGKDGVAEVAGAKPRAVCRFRDSLGHGGRDSLGLCHARGTPTACRLPS